MHSIFILSAFPLPRLYFNYIWHLLFMHLPGSVQGSCVQRRGCNLWGVGPISCSVRGKPQRNIWVVEIGLLHRTTETVWKRFKSLIGWPLMMICLPSITGKLQPISPMNHIMQSNSCWSQIFHPKKPSVSFEMAWWICEFNLVEKTHDWICCQTTHREDTFGWYW